MPSISRYRDGWRTQICVDRVRVTGTFRTQREANAWGLSTEYKMRQEAAAKKELAARLGVKYGAESAHAILTHKIPLYAVPGIYILFIDNTVTYVGQSMNAVARVLSHSEKGRQFTHYHVIPCFPEDLDEKEEYYINLLQPPENRTFTGNRDSRGRIKKKDKQLEATP